MLRVLIFANTTEDYLQDSIIHGFKKLLGANAVEFPTKHILYDDYTKTQAIRGKGFTLYSLLDKNLKPSENINIEQCLRSNYFDIIIFSSIHRQYHEFYKHFKLLKNSKANVWIIDGEDSQRIFPFMRKYFRFILNPKPHNHFIYFKRELIFKLSANNLAAFFLNKFNKLILPKTIKRISFSIPEEKIVTSLPQKAKMFTRHIIDNEVAQHINDANSDYIFNTEADYYLDIQKSKFGITTKRGGWDCMRHYEIAANGTVICFRDLDLKPESCSPHGLIPDYNCICYKNYSDLINRINSLSDEKYQRILNNSLQWAKQHTTIKTVEDLITSQNSFSNLAYA